MDHHYEEVLHFDDEGVQVTVEVMWPEGYARVRAGLSNIVITSRALADAADAAEYYMEDCAARSPDPHPDIGGPGHAYYLEAEEDGPGWRHMW